MAYREQTSGSAPRFPYTAQEDAEFSGEAFLSLPLEQRVRYCTKAAELAHNRANAAPESHKISYLQIAQEWLRLAEAILRDSEERKERDRAF